MTSKDTFFSKKRTFNFRGKLIDIQSPIVMGIINITPDSFYESSRFCSEQAILKRCEQILLEGATIIDLGAYSSRPGAENISQSDELNRINPALKAIRKEFPDVILSLDTFRSEVARITVEEFNIQLINDITAGSFDDAMFSTIASLKVPYVIMHMEGDLMNMHQKHHYKDVMLDIIQYFAGKIESARQSGIHDLILDPGFGFSKNLEQNYQILNHLDDFKIFELPILVGLSRKSMIYKLLDSNPEESLNGTVVVNTLALIKGADILRVHDVKESIEVIKIVSAYKNTYF